MNILVYALIVIAIYAAGGASGWELRRWYDAETVSAMKVDIANRNTADAMTAAATNKADADATKKAADALAARSKTTEDRNNERQKAIASLSDDAACRISGDLVRLHDTAAATLPVSGSAKTPDGTAKAVACRAVILAAARNYDACHDNADKLTDLQRWIDDVKRRE